MQTCNVKRGSLLGVMKSLLVYYPDTGRVLKHKLVKFVTKRVAECQTQTDLQMSDDDLHGKSFIFPMPESKMADQSSKDTQGPQIESSESDNDTQTGQEGDSHSTHYPNRERKSPQYLNDYECKVECNDQILANSDY